MRPSKRKDWQWIVGVVIVVTAVGALADWAMQHFIFQVNAQAVNLSLTRIAQQWDNFFEFAARNIVFQRTLALYEDLLNPQRRSILIRDSGSWIDEMRKSASANFWVFLDDKGKPVVSFPLGVDLPSWRPVWSAPFRNYPCNAALFAGANGDPAFVGVGIDITINDKKRGELWLLYRFEALSQGFLGLPFQASFELATVKGDIVFGSKHPSIAETSKLFRTYLELRELPLLLIVSVPSDALTEGVALLRLVHWGFLLLAVFAVASIVNLKRRVVGRNLAVKLTEIFHLLSERFLETRDAEEVFQALADAIVREFRFSLAIVFRFEQQAKIYSATGYAPRHLLQEILTQKEESKLLLSLSNSIPQLLQSGAAYVSSDFCEFFGDRLPEKVGITLQNLLQLRLIWCALLFAEGKPVGALLVGTSQEQFSDEESQALELVRQQAAMLLTMISSWEEQERARERANRFQEVLLRLNRDLPQRRDLVSKLKLIAQEAQEALAVDRVNIWQVSTDRQNAYCVVAVGEDSEQLVGTILPVSRYLTYIASLEDERVIATSSVLTDPRTDELADDYWRPYGIEATMDAPVRVEGKIVGIVCCEHKTSREWNSDEIGFVGDIADLVARVILESQQQRRERYLTTLSQLALQMLVATDWQGVLPIFLEDMGRVAEADRSFLAKLIVDENGHEIMRCLGIWSADGFVEEEREFLLDEVGAPYQVSALRMGEPIFSVVRTLPEPYRKFYEQRGVKTILAIPIFVESRWWGVLGFSMRRTEHYWDEVDIAILRIAGSLLGSVIERQMATERQFEQEKQFRELVENATVGIYRSTPDGLLLMANPALAKMLGYESPEEAVSSITNLATQVYTDPNYREDFKRMMAERGLVQNFIVPLRRKNGEIFWASVSGRCVYAPDGRLLYYEGFVLDITARKRAEELLTQRIKQLQALYRLTSTLQQSHDLDEILAEVMKCMRTAMKADRAFIALVDPDGKMRFKAAQGFSEKFKQAIEDFFARSPSAFVMQPLIITDMRLASNLGSLQQVFLDEGIGSYLCVPIVYQDKFLGRLNVSFNSPRNFTDDEINLTQTIAHHLAFAIAHKEAEERVLRSEREFRSLFENAVVGIYRSTPEGRFLMANETLARINGYDSVEELMNLDIPTQIYLNPEDRARFKKLMVEQGFVSDYRYPIKRKDGSIGWVTKWARAVRDEDGEVIYYEGFVLDITEQVQLEQRLRALQTTARSLVMRLDIESVIQIAVNEMSSLFPDSAVLVFRYQEETDSFTLEGANEEAKDLLRVLRLSVGSTFKRRGFSILENRLWSGEGFLVSDLSDTVGSSLQELTDLGYKSIFVRGIGDSSQLWGMIAICRKGTNFAQQDIDFVNSFCDYLSIAIRNASLFQQVQQAYEELRAIQERIMEQERLRALGQIASGIAHDINNALVPIQGFAEILMEHGDPMVRDAAEVIFKSANDITATVQRMREFYKVRSSEEVLEPVNLNSICQDALIMTRPKWFNMPRERGIVIETQLELADDLPPLMGIPGEIRQAIVNLIMNAVDAMPEGGTLTIRTYRRDKGGRAWAVVEVSDTGIGMDEEIRRRAIEPFFTTKGERGSGLGLAAVYGTVQRHEGFMEIDSEVGKGTTVRLWFPSNVTKTIELPEGELPSLRLLVIDDEPSVRETLALLLRKDGHVVSTAVDGEEGLELFQVSQLQGKPFNVVITDLGMPKLDGMAVAKKIKEIAPETPVVLLSGWGFRIRSEEVKDFIDLVLTKPATHQQIRRALSQIWNRRMALSN
ncbi:MAG: GAF domain-containing protein [Armatimonadota bacterium]|nr:GAF domain-containing protein [Armatimonadota bacterium]MDW8142609.1 GAF domain-containing protein [Armatimonadota bacterium]